MAEFAAISKKSCMLAYLCCFFSLPAFAEESLELNFPGQEYFSSPVAHPSLSTPLVADMSEFRSVPGLKSGTGDAAFLALSLTGIRYKYGGNTPESGLDCSGFVRYVFKESLGKILPRSSEEISHVGNSIEDHELQPGDLVFFNTLKRAFSHVGIYLGENKFIHAPSAGGKVRVENMNVGYWKQRFNGARRLIGLPPKD